MYQFYYFLRRILFTVIVNPSCPFVFNLSVIVLYMVLFHLIYSIYSIRINIKILGDKVFYCVLREEFLHLAVKLRCQCFIVRKYQGWFVELAMTFAIVKVLPEPVTPSKVSNWLPSLKPLTSCSIACG